MVKQTTLRDDLEGTYIVRVFSEFETALAHFTRTLGIRRPRTTRALVERVRSRARIAQRETDVVHRVREYRSCPGSRTIRSDDTRHDQGGGGLFLHISASASRHLVIT